MHNTRCARKHSQDPTQIKLFSLLRPTFDRRLVSQYPFRPHYGVSPTSHHPLPHALSTLLSTLLYNQPCRWLRATTLFSLPDSLPSSLSSSWPPHPLLVVCNTTATTTTTQPPPACLSALLSTCGLEPRRRDLSPPSLDLFRRGARARTHTLSQIRSCANRSLPPLSWLVLGCLRVLWMDCCQRQIPMRRSSHRRDRGQQSMSTFSLTVVTLVREREAKQNKIKWNSRHNHGQRHLAGTITDWWKATEVDELIFPNHMTDDCVILANVKLIPSCLLTTVPYST